MAAADYISTVQGFYVSYYGRPADPAGLTYWTERLNTEGGNLSAILNAFGTSAEATRRFGTGTNDAKIQAIYQQTFGRAADAEGLAFYNAELTAGRITLIDVAKRVIDGAKGDDVAIRANRLAAAETFTTALNTDAEKAGYAGSGAEDAARSWISTVTKDAATLTAARATVDATITSLLPQTFTLTTNQDKWTGSAGNDTVTGGATTLSTTDTLGASDQIDGGGGEDTANLSITKNFTGFTVGTGFLKNVETVNLTNTTTSGVTFTAKAVTGVKTYNVSGPVSVTGIDSLTTQVNLSGLAAAAAATVNVSYADEITTGTSDSVTIGVNGLGRASTTTDPFASTDITVNSAGVETINLSSAGANYMQVSGAQAKAMTYAGAGTLVLNAVPATLKTYDASTATAAQTIQFANATNMTSVKTGTANDTIRVAPGILRADASVDAGDGTDTLEVITSADITGAWTLAGVETLRLTNSSTANTTGDLVLSPSAATGLKTIEVRTTVGSNNGSSITGLGSNPITVDLRAAASSDQNSKLTVENTAAATLNVSIGTATSTVTAVDDVTFSKATSLEITLPKFATYSTGTITASKATSVTISGAGTLTLSGDANGAANVNSIVLPAATSLTLNQTESGASWAVDIADGTATTAPLTDLSITAAGLITLESEDTTSLTNVERLTIATDKAFSYTTVNFGKASSVVLSGSKDDSAVTLGKIGGDNAYGLSLTATALKAGLDVDAINVGTGQTISVDISGKTGSGDTLIGATANGGMFVGGSVTGGTQTLPTTMGGAVNLNAKNATSTGSLIIEGAISAASVTLDASGSSFGSGTSEEVTFGTEANNANGKRITGDTVVIKSGAAPNKFSVADIYVKNSLTFDGPSVVSANGTSDVNIYAGTNSTALTVALQGGVIADEFKITGVSSNTSITVTGDLKAGIDVLTIDGSASTASAGQTIDASGLASTNVTVIGSARIDTIKGSAGDDVITARDLGDVIDISQGGNDTVVLRSPVQDTGEFTKITNSLGVERDLIATGVPTTIAANDYISTTAFDKITGFGAGDLIVGNGRSSGDTSMAATTALQTIGQKFGVGYALTSTGTALVASDAGAGTKAIDVFIQGTYSASTNRFTVSSGGADTLYLIDGNGTAGGSVYGIVLVGYVAGGSTDSDATGNGYTGLVGAALPS